MSNQLRIPSPWTQLGIFLGLFGTGFVVTSIVMILYSVATGNPIVAEGETDVATLKTLQGISSVTIFLLPSLAFALIVFLGNYARNLGFNKVYDNRLYLFATAIIVLGFPFLYLLSEINSLVPLPQWMIEMEERTTQQLMEFLKAGSITDVLINLLIIAVLPAICEEVCFRGALQPVFIRITGKPILGIIVTAAFFSALHLQFQGFLPRFYLGVMLGLLFLYSGSILPSILAHFINNGVQVMMVSSNPEYVEHDPNLPIWMGLISGGLIAWLLMTYIRISRASAPKPVEVEQEVKDFGDINKL